jgi:signal transduction histidine kinase
MKKIKYRDQILLYFSLLLFAVSLSFLYILFQNEKRSKIEQLQSRMYPYAELVYNFRDSLSSIKDLLPSGLRVTVIDTSGVVLFDNVSGQEKILENHSTRPEMIEAAKYGSGSALRQSSTFGRKYLYYARRFPGLYIRTALEYNSEIKPAIERDNIYIFTIMAMFCLVIFSILYISRKISRPLSSLKEFIDMVQKGKGDYENIHFPSNEFGEVGEKIIQSFRQLEQTKQYKQELTHNVAHELKTPVTGIRGYLETLLQQENINPEQRRFFLERAYAQILRLSALVSDISLLNNIEEGSERFVSEKINIRECIKEIENDLYYRLQEKKIGFIVDIGESVEIEGIYLLIYSLFRNLVENAIEHGGEGIKIYAGALPQDNEYIKFCFYDTGKGVPPEHLNRIFERFYRVESGRSRKSGGSGLGLSIVRNAVTLHRGTISVVNRESGGLQFDFTLASHFRNGGISE